MADQFFQGGSVWSTRRMVSNTTTPDLYETSRNGLMFYAIPAPNGNYSVTLKFADLVYANAGEREFNVQINGTPVLQNFDIVAAAGGFMTALDQTFPVTVKNGAVVLGFTPGAMDLPAVNAIQILPAQPGAPR